MLFGNFVSISSTVLFWIFHYGPPYYFLNVCVWVTLVVYLSLRSFKCHSFHCSCLCIVCFSFFHLKPPLTFWVFWNFYCWVFLQYFFSSEFLIISITIFLILTKVIVQWFLGVLGVFFEFLEFSKVSLIIFFFILTIVHLLIVSFYTSLYICLYIKKFLLCFYGDIFFPFLNFNNMPFIIF